MTPANSMSPNYRIELEGLSFRAPWGVSDQEKCDGCAIEISLVLSVNGDAPESDRLADTVDYSRIAGLVDELARTGGNLIEFLANQIADRCLTEFAKVSWVEVSVRKVPAPMPTTHRSVGVKILKTRPGDPDANE
ncbi:MAG: dihydroneopterin aldolase [Fimbriimonadaceae bacterium]|nr:dihydroneopterin aldolase [Fimbriimonadaceae bacterium]